MKSSATRDPYFYIKLILTKKHDFIWGEYPCRTAKEMGTGTTWHGHVRISGIFCYNILDAT